MSLLRADFDYSRRIQVLCKVSAGKAGDFENVAQPLRQAQGMGFVS